MRRVAYVYPGFHPIPERDESFYPGFTEWDLVDACRPRFEGHAQPRLPAAGWGRYDDRDPHEVGRRIALAGAHGIDAFVYGFFWCRGKRAFQDALDLGFLGAREGATFPFAVMWANRMPRRVLPVRRADLPVIEADRLVPSDVDDFVTLVAYLAEKYFRRPSYLTVCGKPYFSIFDSTFFVRELGVDGARTAIQAARAWLRTHDLPDLHLGAIDPSPEIAPLVRELGFDSVTHYVFLPYWKGELFQDYADVAARRAGEWPAVAQATALPYFPSIAPGWDASPRAADFGAEKPRKYPWWPIVVGEHPDRFQEALVRGAAYARHGGAPDPLLFIASMNEWSEGHYLEPDERFGLRWLEAVQKLRG